MEYEITGYRIREALKQWNLRAATLHKQFTNSLKRFEDEEEADPRYLSNEALRAEFAIAKLQEVQEKYNLAVTLPFENRRLTLSQAVKMLGGLTRAEREWKEVSQATNDRASIFGNQGVRDPEKKYARDTISVKDATEEALKAARRTSALRSAIAVANAKTVFFGDDPELSEFLGS